MSRRMPRCVAVLAVCLSAGCGDDTHEMTLSELVNRLHDAGAVDRIDSFGGDGTFASLSRDGMGVYVYDCGTESEADTFARSERDRRATLGNYVVVTRGKFAVVIEDDPQHPRVAKDVLAALP